LSSIRQPWSDRSAIGVQIGGSRCLSFRDSLHIESEFRTPDHTGKLSHNFVGDEYLDFAHESFFEETRRVATEGYGRDQNISAQRQALRILPAAFE
jgi:hypothetical protein